MTCCCLSVCHDAWGARSTQLRCRETRGAARGDGGWLSAFLSHTCEAGCNSSSVLLYMRVAHGVMRCCCVGSFPIPRYVHAARCKHTLLFSNHPHINAVNSHVKFTFKNGAWDEGELVKEPYVKVHIANTALHYGQSVFEGLKAFHGKDGRCIFVLDFDRFFGSCACRFG